MVILVVEHGLMQLRIVAILATIPSLCSAKESRQYEKAHEKTLYAKTAREKITSRSKRDLNDPSNKHTNLFYSDFNYKE